MDTFSPIFFKNNTLMSAVMCETAKTQTALFPLLWGHLSQRSNWQEQILQSAHAAATPPLRFAFCNFQPILQQLATSLSKQHRRVHDNPWIFLSWCLLCSSYQAARLELGPNFYHCGLHVPLLSMPWALNLFIERFFIIFNLIVWICLMFLSRIRSFSITRSTMFPSMM